MKISLFIPCLVDQFYPGVGKHTYRILKRFGFNIAYSDEQICCGQLLFKSGYWEKTRPLAKRTIRAFGKAEILVAPSGSCVNMIRHHYTELFRDDPLWLERAQALSSKTYELTEFLVNVAHIEDPGASFQKKVTYHDSCQVLRALGISKEPRQLIQHVRGIEFIEMADSDVCCGFGGIFSFKNPHIARAMVEEKVRNILATGAEWVTGCEISCLMHIDGYMRHQKIPVRAVHIAELLGNGF